LGFALESRPQGIEEGSAFITGAPLSRELLEAHHQLTLRSHEGLNEPLRHVGRGYPKALEINPFDGSGRKSLGQGSTANTFNEARNELLERAAARISFRWQDDWSSAASL